MLCVNSTQEAKLCNIFLIQIFASHYACHHMYKTLSF